MPPPAHARVTRHISHVGIADMSFTRSDPVGAVLPASDLIVVSILTRAHNDLLTCGTVTRYIVICQRRILCIGQVLQSRPALGLCMTCLSAVVTRLSLSQTM